VEPGTEIPGLRSVEPIRDPFPRASFGSIGRYVKVECEPTVQFFRPRLTIPYSPEDLGWVDPTSLRVFEVDLESGEFRLVHRSMPDPEQMEVHAIIERSGIYGLIGLPRDQALLRVIRALSALIPPLGDAEGIEVGDLMGIVCGRILCLPPEEGGVRDDLVPPGGVEGDACQFCLGRSIPSNGLPEFQLLPLPPHRRQWGRVPSASPVPGGPYLYALLSHNGGQSPDAIVEIVDLSTMTYVQTVPVGSFAGGRIAPTPHGICFLDWAGGTVVLIDAMGGKRSVPVGLSPYGCVASLDGSSLYVSVRGSIIVLDVAAGQITQTVAALGQEYFLQVSLSPDGRTLAAGTEYSSFVYVFDTATLTPRRVAITDPQVPVYYTEVVQFAESGLLLVWDGQTDRMYTVDVATATQLPGIIDGLPPRTPGVYSASLSYSGTKRRAYEARGVTYTQGELVVVDLGASTASLRSGFAGLAGPTCLNPRDAKTLFIGVEERDPATLTPVRISLDAYDTQADSFARGVYTFRNQQSNGKHFVIPDMKIMD